VLLVAGIGVIALVVVAVVSTEPRRLLPKYSNTSKIAENLHLTSLAFRYMFSAFGLSVVQANCPPRWRAMCWIKGL
jgi:hypothetical protein